MRKTTPKRIPRKPDPKFNDTLVTRFVNNLMYDGKKSIAYNIFYEAVAIVEKRTEESGYEVWKKALENVSPSVEVKSRRVGGATFQIPMEIRPDRKTALGIKWLIMFSRKRNEKSMAQKLASEIIAASKGEGAAHKKKEDTHRMAEANKAFSHFRF
ncbi:MAG: 30S ribosomal protein S7 [Flavobacteriales bacterium]